MPIGHEIIEGDKQGAPLKKPVAFGDLLLYQIRVDRALVNVKERHVIVENLVEEDDELHKVGVCLLPERLLALSIKVVQERRDPVSERVGVQIVVERIVPVRRL